MPSLKERAKTLIEADRQLLFIFADRPLEIEPKAAGLLTPETRELIGKLRTALEAVTGLGWRRPKPPMRISPRPQPQLGAVAQPLRVALTGRTTSPGIFDVLAVLGAAGMPGPARRSGPGISPAMHPLRTSCSAHCNKLPI